MASDSVVVAQRLGLPTCTLAVASCVNTTDKIFITYLEPALLSSVTALIVYFNLAFPVYRPVTAITSSIHICAGNSMNCAVWE